MTMTAAAVSSTTEVAGMDEPGAVVVDVDVAPSPSSP